MTLTDRMLAHMTANPIVRASELVKLGITPATLARAVSKGLVIKIGRGLYQLPETNPERGVELVEVTKRIPKATICLMSALAWYGVTDQLPRKVWIAIGARDRASRMTYPPIKTVRFREPYVAQDKTHISISGVKVPIYTLEKTLADAFRNPRLIDKSVALESLKNALAERMTTPGKISEVAERNGAYRAMRPYLEALTFNG